MKELAIGEKGIVDGKLVKCVEWDTLEGGCNGCAFYNGSTKCGTDRPCAAIERKDKRSVMFILVDSCTWTEDPDGIWYTSCEHAHEFNTGTPEENEHRYCPYCGKVLETKEYEE